MMVRLFTKPPVLAVLFLALVVGAVMASGAGASSESAVPRPRPASDVPPIPVTSDDDFSDPIVAPPAPDQDLPGVGRLLSEDFERRDFPSLTSKWSLADRCAFFPGRRDIIGFGRRECNASHGRASLWAVGGGDVGKALGCSEPYPVEVADPRRKVDCTYIDTMLRYTSFDLSSVTYGLRITFDLLADMPEGALRLMVGVRENSEITFTEQATDFTANTGGEWERGIVREFTSVAGKPQVVLAFYYLDKTPTGTQQGATIDNVHIDALYEKHAPLIPSPTTPAPPTKSPTPTIPVIMTSTPSATPTFGPSPTPTATPRPQQAFLPITLKHHDMHQKPEPTVTRPTPTITPTPSNTPLPTNTLPPPTKTPPATRTPKPTNTPITPTITPRPSPTPVPKPDVQIVDILPLPIMPGTQLEVVTLKNIGTAPQDMGGWRLFNLSHDENCRFQRQDPVILQPGQEYEIRSGRDAVTDETGMACSNKYIWDNRQDEGQLYNDRNRMVSCRAYDENGQYNCMPEEQP